MSALNTLDALATPDLAKRLRKVRLDGSDDPSKSHRLISACADRLEALEAKVVEAQEAAEEARREIKVAQEALAGLHSQQPTVAVPPRKAAGRR